MSSRHPCARLYAADLGVHTRRSPRRWVGRTVRSVARLAPNPDHDRTLGTVLVLVLGLSFVNLALAASAAVGAWVRSVLVRRRAERNRHEQIEAALGDVIDLCAVVLASGGTVTEAVREISEWSSDDIAADFAWCVRQAASGRSLANALEDMPGRIGSQVRPLTAALVATERYGAPITESLSQLARDVRADRRRRAETAARRLPIALLFPLVVCVLPAFLLVTVVPVVFETLSNFELSVSP